MDNLPFFHPPSILFFFLPILLGYNWHTALYKFKVYSIMIQHKYIMKWLSHSSFIPSSEHPISNHYVLVCYKMCIGDCLCLLISCTSIFQTCEHCYYSSNIFIHCQLLSHVLDTLIFFHFQGIPVILRFLSISQRYYFIHQELLTLEGLIQANVVVAKVGNCSLFKTKLGPTMVIWNPITPKQQFPKALFSLQHK